MLLAHDLFHFSGVVCNVFALLGAEGVTLVDAGLPYSYKRILAQLAALGVAASDVKHILITHADRDHVGSLAALKALTGACVYASRLEAEAMAAGEETRRLRLKPWQQFAFDILRLALAHGQPIAADEIVQEGDVLPIYGGLRVVETPGHTPGHLSFYAAERGVLFAGDSLRSFAGRLRVSSGPNTADEARARESMLRQAALAPALICTGHGPAVRGSAPLRR